MSIGDRLQFPPGGLQGGPAEAGRRANALVGVAASTILQGEKHIPGSGRNIEIKAQDKSTSFNSLYDNLILSTIIFKIYFNILFEF